MYVDNGKMLARPQRAQHTPEITDLALHLLRTYTFRKYIMLRKILLWWKWWWWWTSLRLHLGECLHIAKISLIVIITKQPCVRRSSPYLLFYYFFFIFVSSSMLYKRAPEKILQRLRELFFAPKKITASQFCVCAFLRYACDSVAASYMRMLCTNFECCVHIIMFCV